MIRIPPPLEAEYEGWLPEKAIQREAYPACKKWVRFYLDFCHQYGFRATNKDSLSSFLAKLHEKNQTKSQQGQAAVATGLLHLSFEENASAASFCRNHGPAPQRAFER